MSRMSGNNRLGRNKNVDARWRGEFFAHIATGLPKFDRKIEKFVLRKTKWGVENGWATFRVGRTSVSFQVIWMPPSGRHRLKINGIDWLNDLVMAYIDRPRTSIAALSPPKKNQLCGSCWKFTFKKSSPGICNAYTTCSLPTVTESRGEHGSNFYTEEADRFGRNGQQLFIHRMQMQQQQRPGAAAKKSIKRYGCRAGTTRAAARKRKKRNKEPLSRLCLRVDADFYRATRRSATQNNRLYKSWGLFSAEEKNQHTHSLSLFFSFFSPFSLRE